MIRSRIKETAEWLAHLLVPTRLRRFQPVPVDRFLMICIYRHRNTKYVGALVREALDHGAYVRLWALESTPPNLRRWTIGTGRGTRTQLLNRLHAGHEGVTLVADDDIGFSRGHLSHLLAIGYRAGFDAFQPAHDPRSVMSHPWTVARKLTLARRLRAIEVGPMVVLQASATDAFFPLDEGFEMGWGIDVLWAERAASTGLSLGIVDAVTIRHHGKVAADYDPVPELARMTKLMRERGFERLDDIQQELGRWAAWQERPPWSDP